MVELIPDHILVHSCRIVFLKLGSPTTFYSNSAAAVPMEFSAFFDRSKSIHSNWRPSDRRFGYFAIFSVGRSNSFNIQHDRCVNYICITQYICNPFHNIHYLRRFIPLSHCGFPRRFLANSFRWCLRLCSMGYMVHISQFLYCKWIIIMVYSWNSMD